jgi:hypothetical protein
LEKKKWKTFMAVIGALVLLDALWIIIDASYLSSSIVGAMESLWIPFVFITIPSLIFVVMTKIKASELNLAVNKTTAIKKGVAVCIAGAFLSITILAIDIGSGKESDGRIIIYTRDMLGNLNKPEYGNYGQYAGGMFGLLTDYLNASGYSANVYGGEVNESALNNINIFVAINLGRYFNDTEYNAIWNFVERGGSLLVLGDHTDMGGMMNHSNRLLAPVGIKYVFDAALPVNELWINSLQTLPHPITHGINMEECVEISVGASLELGNPFKAQPVIIGRYGLSDIGNYLNAGRGAYLGEYQYEVGEHLGDIVLAASSNYGKGKIAVFGDTSIFQNAAWLRSHPFVNNVFGWLGSNSTEQNPLFSLFAIPILAASLIGLTYLKPRLNAHHIFALAICASIVFSAGINFIAANDVRMRGDIVYIDSSKNDLFNKRGSSDDSIDGLIHNIMRNNYLPLTSYNIPHSLKNNPKMIFFIAPTGQFTKTETAMLMDYMSNGGVVVVSCGWMEKEGSSPLLDKMGFEIANQPLGPVPYTEKEPEKYTMQPKFMDAWPISIQDESNVSIFYKISIENESYNLVVFKQYGDGGLLLISDSRFLLNKNLESKDMYWPGNIQFFRDILDKLKQMGALS